MAGLASCSQWASSKGKDGQTLNTAGPRGGWGERQDPDSHPGATAPVPVPVTDVRHSVSTVPPGRSGAQDPCGAFCPNLMPHSCPSTRGTRSEQARHSRNILFSHSQSTSSLGCRGELGTVLRAPLHL